MNLLWTTGLLAMVVSALAPSLAAQQQQQQQVQLAVRGPQPGVVRLGEEAEVQIVLEGSARFSAEFTLPEVEGLRFRRGGARREENQSFFNGRISVTRRVTYPIGVRPTRAGVFTIPPFDVAIGGATRRTRPLKIEAVADLRGEDQAFVEVVPSAQRVYVHEPITFAVEFGVREGLRVQQGQTRNRTPYTDVEVQAEWLDELEGAISVETEPDVRNPVGVVQNGKLQAAELTRGFQRDGKTYNRYRFDVSFLPSRSGVRKLAAPLLRFSVSTGRARRGVFGELINGSAENFYAYGQPVEFEVLPIPEEGRPANYHGAVGRFEVTAVLDRQRVKVGDSVKLNLSITGRGNMEFLRPPELDAIEGFHLLGRTEERSADRVLVTYDLTPLTDQVSAVPAVAWNYFDTTPGVERFVEVATEELPLEVVPLAEGEALAALPGEEAAAVTPGVDDIFDMKPAARTLPRTPAGARAPGLPLSAGLLLAPWLLCVALLGWWGRRSRWRADVAGRRARGAARRFHQALARDGDAGAALVGYLADRLAVAQAAVIGPDLAARLTAVGIAPDLAAEVQETVDAAVASRYGGTEGLSAADAGALVTRLEAVELDRKNPVPLGVALWLAVGLGMGLGTGDLAAQSAGEKAYRRGDYGAAAVAFEQEVAAAEGAVDGNLLYNLGNSLFRLGRLGEALLAYERARLVLPRDRELLANIALVRQRLELGSGEGEPFVDAVASLRARLTPRELFWLAMLCNALAALGLVLGWRRRPLRILGAIALVPALGLALEVLWLGPARPPSGIVVRPRAELLAEPRMGLEPLLKLREGVEVAVLSQGPEWAQVEVRGRSGYLPVASVGVVR